MTLSFSFHNIQWIPVLVTTVLSFVIGALWHQPFLFGKPWAEENKADKDALKAKAPFIFGGTAVMHFVALSALSALVSGTCLSFGIIAGLGISIFWVLPAMAGTYFFAGRSVKLLLIDAGMYIVLFVLAGIILAIW